MRCSKPRGFADNRKGEKKRVPLTARVGSPGPDRFEAAG